MRCRSLLTSPRNSEGTTVLPLEIFAVESTCEGRCCTRVLILAASVYDPGATVGPTFFFGNFAARVGVANKTSAAITKAHATRGIIESSVRCGFILAAWI